MLCYVTPREHLGLPKKEDVKQGCVAYKIAAHAADVALGIPGARDRDDELTKARAALNWERHFELSFDPELARAWHDEDLPVDTDFCAMCGHDWCSVRISKEIMEFGSGKAPEAQPETVSRVSPAVVAAKAREAAEHHEKLGCHSDVVADDEAARRVQERLVAQRG
jgi:phosphomethylpyrimidine synthase